MSRKLIERKLKAKPQSFIKTDKNILKLELPSLILRSMVRRRASTAQSGSF